jgi:hypothetical protein
MNILPVILIPAVIVIAIVISAYFHLHPDKRKWLKPVYLALAVSMLVVVIVRLVLIGSDFALFLAVMMDLVLWSMFASSIEEKDSQ